MIYTPTLMDPMHFVNSFVKQIFILKTFLRATAMCKHKPTALIPAVAEPPELSRFKCASHRYTADTNSTDFKRNNPLVCRISARCSHGSTGSKQVYLTRRWVYNHTTAHQLLIHEVLNIITNRFKLKVINKYCLKRQAKQLARFTAEEN
jgi:hypothetical protein